MLAALSATGCGVHARAPAEPIAGGPPQVGAASDGTIQARIAADGTIPVDQLPGWQRDGLNGLGDALRRQCAMRTPPAPWPAACKELAPIVADTAKLRGWIETRFVAKPLAGADGRGDGLITGYHEPLLTGSRRRESPSQVPLHRRPADLSASGDARHRVVNGRRLPYPSRAEIEGSGLLEGSELVWLDDPVEAFFLQVQGSGRVKLRDGTTLRVGFADHNGHRYRAIGAVLVERGEIPRGEVDAPRIKAWLRAHPQRAREVMHSNPRYIFFRELPASADADAGPPGSLGVPLTPMRSVATDPAFVSPGALLYLETRYPDDGRLLARAMLNQDRGAAILGGVRADIFFGAGEEAERLAGLMQEPGRIWQLVPRISAPSTPPASD